MANDDLDTKLAELRKRAADQQRQQRDDAAAEVKRLEISRLERDIADNEKFAELQRTLSAAAICRVDSERWGMVVVRNPGRGRWDEFQDSIKGESDLNSQKAYRLIVDCLVYPSVDRLDEILDAAPATLATFVAAVGRAAGNSDAVIQKK